MTEEEKKEKRSYEKPRLRTIELAAEEVLAVGCKSDSGFNFGLPGCGVANNCATSGS